MNENTFTMTSWDERVISGPETGPRFAYAHTTSTYTGVIAGESVCDYLLYYAGEGYGGAGTTSPGLERIEGSVAGRAGSFLIRHDVGYDQTGVHGTWTVVPGSGTGELDGLTGGGTIDGASQTMSYSFDYSFG